MALRLVSRPTQQSPGWPGSSRRLLSLIRADASLHSPSSLAAVRGGRPPKQQTRISSGRQSAFGIGAAGPLPAPPAPAQGHRGGSSSAGASGAAAPAASSPRQKEKLKGEKRKSLSMTKREEGPLKSAHYPPYHACLAQSRQCSALFVAGHTMLCSRGGAAVLIPSMCFDLRVAGGAEAAGWAI